ncbi:MAG: tRNA (adenosine(37)-N6)-threonylcarbamoyltransferase complex dimerization subunit type 1 TsaB [Sphingobacteriaceae bacterium]
MAVILNIETASTNCSVSLCKDGDNVFTKELNEGFTHAENLHTFIADVLKETNIGADQLNAIAVSKGPGSYTGLRIGVSAAKGLSYALNVPLIAINTLQILSAKAKSVSNRKDVIFCPMLDARRMEVYTAMFDGSLTEINQTQALIISEESIEQFDTKETICFFGDGMPKCKELLGRYANHVFIDGLIPSAKEMAQLSEIRFKNKQFEDVAYFEPFYLKDFMITKKQV